MKCFICERQIEDTIENKNIPMCNSCKELEKQVNGYKPSNYISKSIEDELVLKLTGYTRQQLEEMRKEAYWGLESRNLYDEMKKYERKIGEVNV